MSRPNGIELTLELMSPSAISAPYAFDGQPRQYIARDGNGKTGAAIFRWDLVEELRPEFLTATPSPNAQKQMGMVLKEFLVDILKAMGGWAAYEEALLDAEKRGWPIGLHFRFNALELFSLPWALTLLTGNRRLASLNPCPLSFEWEMAGSSLRMSEAPGRLLFAWSDVADGVSEGLHLDEIQRACSEFDREKDVLAHVTLDSLRDKLRQAKEEGRPYRVLHFLCHGGPVPGGSFGLCWDDPHRPGREVRIHGNMLADVLGAFRDDIQAVVLSACHGGNPGEAGKMLGGVAHDLHQLGIPTVIASQMPMSIDGSIRMTRAFHSALYREKASVRKAFQAAHASLSVSTLDWASLQLFVVPPAKAPPGQRWPFSEEHGLPASVRSEVVVAYEVNFDVPTSGIAEALMGRLGPEPDVVLLRPLGRVADGLPSKRSEWRCAIDQADKLVCALGARVSHVDLFGCAPLPLMFHLGWGLARRKVRVYQQQRGQSGGWSCGYDSELSVPDGEPFFRLAAWPDLASCVEAGGRVVVTVEVQPAIPPEEMEKWLGSAAPPGWVRLVAARGPSPTVVRGPEDTARAVAEFRGYLDRIHQELPFIKEMWLAMTGPASLAAALGRAYNPKVHATLKLFNFRKVEGYVEVPWNGGVQGHPVRRR